MQIQTKTDSAKVDNAAESEKMLKTGSESHSWQKKNFRFVQKIYADMSKLIIYLDVKFYDNNQWFIVHSEFSTSKLQKAGYNHPGARADMTCDLSQTNS